MQMMMKFDFEKGKSIQCHFYANFNPNSFSFAIYQYLTKQNNALREVNDTRLKIYENIEISIQDLEKQNHRLNVDNSNLKKINKK